MRRTIIALLLLCGMWTSHAHAQPGVFDLHPINNCSTAEMIRFDLTADAMLWIDEQQSDFCIRLHVGGFRLGVVTLLIERPGQQVTLHGYIVSEREDNVFTLIDRSVAPRVLSDRINIVVSPLNPPYTSRHFSFYFNIENPQLGDAIRVSTHTVNVWGEVLAASYPVILQQILQEMIVSGLQSTFFSDNESESFLDHMFPRQALLTAMVGTFAFQYISSNNVGWATQDAMASGFIEWAGQYVGSQRAAQVASVLYNLATSVYRQIHRNVDDIQEAQF